MTNTVAFPTAASGSRTTGHDTDVSALSLSYQNTALEVCDLVYGPATPTWDIIERFYEPSAIYENPLITATSRNAIADIHALASALAQLDVPKPAAVLQTLFGISHGDGWGASWFKALRMSHEVTEVCESESFDGHSRTMVEHTLHIVLLPDLHSSEAAVSHPLQSTVSNLSLSLSNAFPQQASFGADLREAFRQLRPSLLHLRLPMITRLSFNDAGKITHHRDFWDVKDVLNLIPGMTLAQWVTTRVLAHSVRGVLGASRLVLGSGHLNVGASGTRARSKRVPDEEEGLSPAAAYAASVKTSSGIGAAG